MRSKSRNIFVGLFSFILVLFLCMGTQKNEGVICMAEEKTITGYNHDEYLENIARPYWESNVIYNEIVMPYAKNDTKGNIGYGQLLYTPLKIISVRDQTLGIEYTENIDWVVDSASRKLYFPNGSKIRCIDEGSVISATKDVSYPTNDTAKYPYAGVLGSADFNNEALSNNGYSTFFSVTHTEGTMFLERYLSVTYVYDTNELPLDKIADSKESPFTAYMPGYLTNLRTKLESGVKEINFLSIGDSISQGCSSTGDLFGIAPYTPCWQKLVCQEIERLYGVKVNYYNMAIGGTTSYYPTTDEAVAPDGSQGGGLSVLKNLLQERDYDLCTIAYGMNDVGFSDASQYMKNIIHTLDMVMNDSPTCNTLLISSFPRNPQVTLDMNKEGVLDTEYNNALSAIRVWYDPENNPDCALKETDGVPDYGIYSNGNVRVINMHGTGDYLMKFEYTSDYAKQIGSVSYNNYAGGKKSYLELSSSNVNHPNDFLHRIYAMNIMAAIYDYSMETYSYAQDSTPIYKDSNGNQFVFAKNENGWANVVQDSSMFGQEGYEIGSYKYYKNETEGIVKDTFGYADVGATYFHANGNNTYFHLTNGGYLTNYIPFDVTHDIEIKYNFSAYDTTTSLLNNSVYKIALFDTLENSLKDGDNTNGLAKISLEGANYYTSADGVNRSAIYGRIKAPQTNEVSNKLIPDTFNASNWRNQYYNLTIRIGEENTLIFANDVLFATLNVKRADFIDGVCYLSVATDGNMAFNFQLSQSYEISYDLAGGTLQGENPYSYTAKEETITLINPIKDGYEFIGWTGTGLTEPTMLVTIDRDETGDKSFVANWKELEKPVEPDNPEDIEGSGNTENGGNTEGGGTENGGNTEGGGTENGGNTEGSGNNESGDSGTSDNSNTGIEGDKDTNATATNSGCSASVNVSMGILLFGVVFVVAKVKQKRKLNR